jgi:hypothetical protein
MLNDDFDVVTKRPHELTAHRSIKRRLITYFELAALQALQNFLTGPKELSEFLKPEALLYHRLCLF